MTQTKISKRSRREKNALIYNIKYQFSLITKRYEILMPLNKSVEDRLEVIFLLIGFKEEKIEHVCSLCRIYVKH